MPDGYFICPDGIINTRPHFIFQWLHGINRSLNTFTHNSEFKIIQSTNKNS